MDGLEDGITTLSLGDHSCLLYQTLEEEMAILVAYLRVGLARSERCLCICDAGMAEIALTRLAGCGVDVEREQARGALVVQTKPDAWHMSHQFLPRRVVALINEALEGALEAGFSGLRAAVDVGWAVSSADAGVADSPVEYEAMIDQTVFVPGRKAVGLCMYDLRLFASSAIEIALSSHPIAIVGGQICPNVYYQQLEMALGEKSDAARLDQKIQRLKRMAGIDQGLRSELLRRTDVLGAELAYRQEIQSRLAKLNRLYAVLSRVNHTLFRIHDREALFEAACQIAVESGVFRMAWVGLVDVSSGAVKPVAHSGVDAGYLDLVTIDLSDDGFGWTPVRGVLRTGEHQVRNDIEHDGLKLPWHGEALKRGYRSIASFPLKASSMLIGAFTVYSGEAGFFDDEELSLLDQFADDVSFVVEALDRDAERKQAEADLLKFKLGIEQSSDAIFMTDVDGRIVYANSAFERTYGFSKDEAIGQTPRIVKSGVLSPEAYQQFWHTLLSKRVVVGEIVNRTRNGSLLQIGSSASPILDEHGSITGFLAIQRDVTENKRAEEKLRETSEMLAALIDASPLGIAVLDLDGCVTLWNPAAERIFGWTREEVLGRPLSTVNEDWQEEYDSTMESIRGGLTLLELERRRSRKDGSLLDVSVSMAPLRDAQGRATGTIAMFADITGRKQAETALAVSLERCRISMEGTVTAVASAAEMRDPYTAGHQRRVASLASVIAMELGLNEEETEAIRMAGLVHDIGKLSVPAEILTRPGKRSELEFNLIKAHPQLAYEILKGIDYPRPIAGMVLQHHERMDGSGYPFGLSQEAILMGARILAVADVVEAMASHRPYRPSLGIDRALAEISRHRGDLFDANVVDACLRLFSEGSFTFE